VAIREIRVAFPSVFITVPSVVKTLNFASSADFAVQFGVVFLQSVPACQALQPLVQTHFSKRAKRIAWYASKMQKPL